MIVFEWIVYDGLALSLLSFAARERSPGALLSRYFVEKGAFIQLNIWSPTLEDQG